MVIPDGADRAAPDVVCIGSAALDVLLVAERRPGADDRVPADAGMMAGGGPAATAAVALARMGARVELVARVADDLPGRIIREQLADEGVGVRWLLVGGPGGASALSSATITVGPPASRSLVALAARPPLVIEELPGDALDACRRARWIHVDHAGWPLVMGLRAMGIRTAVSVDGGNPIDGLELGWVDLYVPALAELRRWTGAGDDASAVSRALDEGARAVIATRGEHGALYAGLIDPDAPWPGDGPDAAPGMPSAPRWELDMPAYRVDARSTLGAGDVYHGALLAALVGDATTMRDAMARAAVAAGLSCLALDGRSAIPDRSRLDAALAAWSPAPSPARRSHA